MSDPRSMAERLADENEPTRDYIPDGPWDDGDEPDDGTWGGTYCKHGTYVGTPGGADYICGACEEGEPA